MTIALIGQQKYDFQDLVCAQLILQFYQRHGIQFWVEPKGGEDAMFVFQGADATDLSFEIQIKGSEEHVDFELIAECLGHFPAYKAENFLLERLGAVEHWGSKIKKRAVEYYRQTKTTTRYASNHAYR